MGAPTYLSNNRVSLQFLIFLLLSIALLFFFFMLTSLHHMSQPSLFYNNYIPQHHIPLVTFKSLLARNLRKPWDLSSFCAAFLYSDLNSFFHPLHCCNHLLPSLYVYVYSFSCLPTIVFSYCMVIYIPYKRFTLLATFTSTYPKMI